MNLFRQPPPSHQYLTPFVFSSLPITLRFNPVGMKLGYAFYFMILSVVKISPHPDNWKEVIDILLSLKGPTRVSSGCLDCSLAQEENEESRTILYIELWNSWENLRHHIRSRKYSRLLGALDLSGIPPEVNFYQISDVKGMEIIEAERDPDSG